jgi:uncharacterized protein (TIGR03067 family)
MSARTMLLLPIAFLLLGADDPKEAVAKDIKALQGTWHVVDHKIAGKSLPKQFYENLQFEFAENKKFRLLTKGKAAKDEDFESYRIDPGKEPKHIDFGDGETQVLGVYKLDGDSLEICWGAVGGKKRPADFKAAEKGERFYALKRVKP